MRRFVLAGLLALAVLGTLSATAFAQLTGTITGNIFDQNGMPLKGVKITAKSPTDIAPKTVFTDEEGFFRIIGLMPGKFDLTAQAQGLKTFVQKGIQVSVSHPYDVPIVMEVESATEEYVIEEKAPVINTATANITDKFDEEFLDALPLESRTNVQGVLANQVAGSVGSDESPQFRGGTSSQNMYMLEGFQVNDVGGGKGQNITFRSVAALEVQTGGYGAENANAAGAVMNAVTKSGSNKYEVELDGFHENTKMQLFMDDLDPRAFGMHSFLAANLSGPIVKDRLWFFATLEGRSNIEVRQRDPLGLRPTPPRRSVNSFRSTGKLTWQISPRNKLQGVYIFNRDATKNGVNGFQIDRDAQSKADNMDFFAGLIWESMLTDSLLFRSQLGVQEYKRDFGPETCRTQPEICDHLSPLRQIDPPFEFQNWNTRAFTHSQTLEFKNSLEYFYDNKTLGNHNIKLTGRFYGARMEKKETTPGDRIYVFDGGEPHSVRELFVNDPVVEDGRYGWAITSAQSYLLHFSLQDQFKLPKYRYLTLTPGVGAFNTAAEDGRGNTVVGFTTFTPHIAAAWDVTHDGRTVVRGSFNNYVDAGNLNVANFVDQSRTIRICEWDPVTRSFSVDCRFEGGASGRTVGLSCGPNNRDADGNECRENLKVPRTYEYTLGVEREVVQGVAIGSDLQYRTYTNPYEDRETNRDWNAAGTALSPTGGFRNGRPTAIMNLETPSTAERTYTGVVTSIKKREGKLKLHFSYQWSMLRGNVVDGFNNAYLNNYAQDVFQYGYLPGDSRHAIRSQAVYNWNAWFSTGVTYNYTSGTPIQLVYFNQVTNQFTDFRARRGFDPGINRNDPFTDTEIRLPDRQDFNLQARVNFKPITRFNAELYADVLNLLALRTSTSVESRVGDALPTRISNDRMQPFRFRLGFRFKY